MDLSTGLDFARNLHSKIVKPLANLPEIFEAAIAAQQTQKDAEARVAALGVEEHDTRNRLNALALQIELTEATLNAKKSDLEAAIVGLQARVDSLELHKKAVEESIQAARATLLAVPQ